MRHIPPDFTECQPRPRSSLLLLETVWIPVSYPWTPFSVVTHPDSSNCVWLFFHSTSELQTMDFLSLCLRRITFSRACGVFSSLARVDRKQTLSGQLTFSINSFHWLAFLVSQILKYDAEYLHSFWNAEKAIWLRFLANVTVSSQVKAVNKKANIASGTLKLSNCTSRFVALAHLAF